MPGNICGGIFSQKAYFGVFVNLNLHELPQFYHLFPILVALNNCCWTIKAEEGTLEDSAPCGLGTEESRLK